MNRRTLTRLLATALLATLAGAASADYAGGDNVTTLIGFKPGGGSDQLAQLTEPYLGETLGVKFINQYVPGATGAIAWTQLATQAPSDGSTVSVTNSPMVVTDYIMNDAIQYDISQLTPIANVVTDPGILVVNKNSPYKTIEDFLKAAKQHPDRITVGNSGVGGDDFFSSLLVEKAAGVQFKLVPFQGDGPSYTAALSGKIDASSNNLSTVYSQIRHGDLRALAVYSKQRLKELPDVPTLKEKNIDVVAGSSRGFSGPADMPDDARQQFIAAVKKMAANPKFQKAAAAQGLEVDIVTGDDYQKMLENMEDEYKVIWNNVKSQVQR